MKLLLPPVSLNDSVAQSVEQRPFKPWALGSSPSWITRRLKPCKQIVCRAFLFSGNFREESCGNVDGLV